MNQTKRSGIANRFFCLFAAVLVAPCGLPHDWTAGARAAGGVLRLTTADEESRQAIPSRLELRTESGKSARVRRTIVSGPGIVLDRTLDLPLSNGAYRFRIVRGPEYRVVTGNFVIEPAAEGERLIEMSRMVDMRAEGFLSGDLAYSGPSTDLSLLMAAEDLHVVTRVSPGERGDRDSGGDKAPSRRSRPAAVTQKTDEVAADEANAEPIWTGQVATDHDGLLVYPPRTESLNDESPDGDQIDGTRIAIADPFAWQLPVWLATGRIDGFFLLGDWLREDRRIDRIGSGRPPAEIGFKGEQGPGRYAEFVYWQLLETGLRPAPLAGTGPSETGSAAGYNRTYAIGQSLLDDDDRRVAPVADEAEFYDAVWAGRSVLTNGPLLRPTLGGYAPGHVFNASDGEQLSMSVELHLAVRDPVDYVEVIHNGGVIYSARLDDFAKTQGVIPPFDFRSSGWVIVRVVTQFEEHYRAAISAPWFIDFDHSPRISKSAVEFFGQWLTDYETELKKLPPERLAPHIKPVRTARGFWRQRLQQANVD